MIDDIDKNLDKVDSILTKTTRIIKKHWLLLLVILITLVGYAVLDSEDDAYYEDENVEYVEDSAEYYSDEPVTEESVPEEYR